jgi:ATP-dependent Clp protease ATP-binding subunit ClpC
VTKKVGERPETQGFALAARRAVEAAEIEAHDLKHPRIGTEHLLLGLLADERSGGGKVLTRAGVTAAALRHKIGESPAPQEPEEKPARDELMPLTPRASRALVRAARFSHHSRSETVGSDHLLLGVLDVEGRAGQVLRGLGFDPVRLRKAIEGVARAKPAPAAGTAAAARPAPVVVQPVVCPKCGAPLNESLMYRVMSARSEKRAAAREAMVLFCAVCGTALGAAAE